MPDTDSTINLSDVRRALRIELANHGHRLSGDTAGTHRALYIMGDGDVARAVFEIKPSADNAVYELMHQGAWVAGMPPRFVVVPSTSAESDSLETLEQMKAVPLLFDVAGDVVEFRDLDRLLQEHLAPS